MKAKEKAEELVFNYQPYVYCFLGSGMLTNTVDKDVEKNNAKQCALIVVDEMINMCKLYHIHNIVIDTKIYTEVSISYWEEVKKEIINL